METEVLFSVLNDNFLMSETQNLLNPMESNYRYGILGRKKLCQIYIDLNQPNDRVQKLLSQRLTNSLSSSSYTMKLQIKKARLFVVV